MWGGGLKGIFERDLEDEKKRKSKVELKDIVKRESKGEDGKVWELRDIF